MESGRNISPLCSIIIPVYNNCFYTRLCLDALRRTRVTNPPYELILVDNGSTDGTEAVLAEYSVDLGRVIRNHANQGFAHAVNQGAAAASGAYLVLLNNDVLIEPGCLRALVDVAELDGSVGAVGALLLYPDGTIQHAGVVFANDRHPNHAFAGYPGDWAEARRLRDYQAVTGACMLVRRELFQSLGGLDEGFSNSFEDIDLCLKLRRAGKRVVLCPDAVACHFESSTPGRFLRDDRNLARLLNRWGEVIVPDMDLCQDHLGAADGLASLMRLEFDTLALRVDRLTAENSHLRRLLAANSTSLTVGQSSECDLLYRPDRPSTTVANTIVHVTVVLVNQGAAWSAGKLRLSYHWRTADTFARVVWDGMRVTIDEDLAPGHAVSVSAPVLMPGSPGHYILEWDAVEEGVAWMSERGVAPYCQSIIVHCAAGFLARIDGLPVLLVAGTDVEVSAHLEVERWSVDARESSLAWRWIGLDGQGNHGPCLLPSGMSCQENDSGVSLRFVARVPASLGRYRLEIGYWLPWGSWVPAETMGGQVGIVAGQKPREAAAPTGLVQTGDDVGERMARSLEEAARWHRLVEDDVYRLFHTWSRQTEQIERQLDMERQRAEDLARLVERLRNGRVMRLLSLFHR